MMPLPPATPPDFYLHMSLSKLFVMRRSSGDASFPKNIYEPYPAMVLIFKDYRLCHFEKVSTYSLKIQNRTPGMNLYAYMFL